MGSLIWSKMSHDERLSLADRTILLAKWLRIYGDHVDVKTQHGHVIDGYAWQIPLANRIVALVGEWAVGARCKMSVVDITTKEIQFVSWEFKGTGQALLYNGSFDLYMYRETIFELFDMFGKDRRLAVEGFEAERGVEPLPKEVSVSV